MPPLIVQREEIEDIIERINRAISKLNKLMKK